MRRKRRMRRNLKILPRIERERTPHITHGAVYSISVDGIRLREERYEKVDMLSLLEDKSRFLPDLWELLLSILRRLSPNGGGRR
mgnify:FL=1